MKDLFFEVLVWGIGLAVVVGLIFFAVWIAGG